MRMANADWRLAGILKEQIHPRLAAKKNGNVV
jgi:hypothetical protein